MCAIVGIYNIEKASYLAYLSLFSMQHRGQEASGITASNGTKLSTIKDRGTVNQVFSNESLSKLKGNMAIGHNRYSTAGDDSILDAQPVFARYDLGEIGLVHNGNLTDAKEVRDSLIKRGAIFQSSMDTENLIHLIAKSNRSKLQDRIVEALRQIEGAYSFIFLSRTKMFVARDRFGFRPLSLGYIGKPEEHKYIVASETCAFDLIGATFIRDVEPGELLIFDGNNPPKSFKIFPSDPHKCIFEYIYFARPDSSVFGKNVYKLRKQMGRELAKELPVEADMVIPVPDSGVVSALGYSEESGIPFEMGIIRNHYVGRTFIEPLQEIRDLKVKQKLNPITNMLKGKRIVVIDDSIVRGTTSKRIIKMLRETGAKEVHLRISSPPTTDPCYYGVDTPTKDELLSSKKSVEEIKEYIEADSLAYLSIEGLMNSVGREQNFCKACFDGKYII